MHTQSHIHTFSSTNKHAAYFKEHKQPPIPPPHTHTPTHTLPTSPYTAPSCTFLPYCHHSLPYICLPPSSPPPLLSRDRKQTFIPVTSVSSISSSKTCRDITSPAPCRESSSHLKLRIALSASNVCHAVTGASNTVATHRGTASYQRFTGYSTVSYEDIDFHSFFKFVYRCCFVIDKCDVGKTLGISFCFLLEFKM